jgi:hypothetical protein
MVNENWLAEWESWFVCQYINWNLTFKIQMYLICFSNPLRRGVLDTTLCDKVCQWLTAGQWFSLGTPVFQPIKLTAMIMYLICFQIYMIVCIYTSFMFFLLDLSC